MHKNRVIVAGSRTFTDFTLMVKKLDKFLANLDNVEIVSGGARGADLLGVRYADIHDLPVKWFLADWDKHGKSAGYRRNEEMANYATHLVAFWDGQSKGTAHMVAVARRVALEVRVVRT